jgi:protein FAM50
VSNPYRLAQSVNDRFISQKTDKEARLKSETVGLVDLNEFQKIKDEIESGSSSSAKTKSSSSSSYRSKDGGTAAAAEPRLNSFTLSFDNDNDNDDDDADDNGKQRKRLPMKKKISKNPFVDTSYLPDREKDDESAKEKERLKGEWLMQQDQIKQESVKIPFMFWDGSGHPAVLEVRKGDSIESFLMRAKQEFSGLRATLIERILFVKDDLIIQHHYSFYDLLLNKIRGKGKPLFQFTGPEANLSIHERPLVVDATWYEANKKILPASKWEPFNASRHFESSK